MKGLVFGNSHVAAVYGGWDQSSALDLDFYAIGGGAGPNVRFCNGRIYPTHENARLRSTIEGVREGGLDLSGYDYLVFCSLGMGAVREEFPSRILRKLSIAEFTRNESGETTPVSRAFLDAAIRKAFSNMFSVEALRTVRTVFDRPIICAPMPVPVVRKLEEAHPLRRTYGAEVTAFTAWLAEAQLQIIRDFAETLGLKVLDYPDPSWAAAGSTPEQYARPDNDPWHMRAAYGRLVLSQVRGALELV